MPVISIEFGGFPKDPWFRIAGRRYCIGDHFDGRHGLDYDVVLSERLFRITVALAIARKIDRRPDAGWRTADQLSLSVDDLAPSEGTRKFLWAALRSYTPFHERELEFTRVPDTHLIQYRPLRKDRGVLAAGRTRGPYRLSPEPGSIVLDVEAGLAYLGHSHIELPTDTAPLEDAIAHALALAHNGDYLSGRAIIVGGLFRGSNPTGTNSDSVARAYYHLGHLSMQLGLSEEAIRSARLARSLFTALRDSGWVASALVTEAHAEAQLGRHEAALNTARRARAALDNIESHRRRWMRTGRVGVVGQCYSRLRNFAAAERTLLYATALAKETNDTHKVYTWTLRRAENFLRQGHLMAAERLLTEAHDFHSQLHITGVEGASLWRVMAHFMVATAQWAEATHWATLATEFAHLHQLQHELRQLTPILAAIEESFVDAH